MEKTELLDTLQSSGICEIKYFEATTSTNGIAREWVDRGALDWSLIVANFQSQGKGRNDRRWICPPGSGLTFSIILRPAIYEFSKAGNYLRFCGLTGLAICQVLAENYQVKPLLKWPNDILLSGKKVAGILVEAIWNEHFPVAIIIGTGINIQKDSVPGTNLFRYPATCLETELAWKVNEIDLLSKIIAQMKEIRKYLFTKRCINELNNYLAFKDQWVIIENYDGGREIVQIREITHDDKLLIQTINNEVKTVLQGEIQIIPLEK